MEYNFNEIEKKWQKYWEDNESFKEHSVFAIEQALDNKIWIGTGDGIFIYN